MRILITGAGGRLGGRLVSVLQDEHDVTGLTRDDLDVTDFAAARRLIQQYQPEVVLHAAAWTNVDGCAREPEKAIVINGYGAQNMALAAAEIDAAIVYVSTNEVFYGQLNRPYLEYDKQNPFNSYGYSKMVGEQVVARFNRKHYIVRTAWVFAHGGRNFIQAILGAVQLGKTLRVVTDEVANPTYNNDLADAIAQLIKTGRYGIYHLVNEGACSRYTFARHVLDQAGHDGVPIQPISSREWPRASIPPAYTAMNNLAGPMVGVSLRPWQEAVDAFLVKEGVYRA
jgi:dTDP-4-dehydrorhamnose reductase